MKIDPKEVSGALDRRLSFLKADPARRARIMTSIHKKEEPIVKRKLTAGLVFALVSVFLLIGVALAASLNLFDYFGKQDERYAKIAPQSTLEAQSVVSLESVTLGQTTAAITGGYYDGTSLMIAYEITNVTRAEVYDPTPEQLAAMQKVEGSLPVPDTRAGEAAAAFGRAAAAGQPAGVVVHEVFPSDHTATKDGIELPPDSEANDVTPEGARYAIREYVFPLPQEAQDKEFLDVQIALHQSTTYFYFDGTFGYIQSGDRQDAGVMAARVQRTASEIKRFTGTGVLDGRDVQITVDATAMGATLMITSDEAFRDLGDDAWYDVVVKDDQGNVLRTQGQDVGPDGHTLVFPLEGSGRSPASLQVYLMVAQEGESQADGQEQAKPIELLPTP